MSFASEFKEFAMKGSVIDLAVGVVIGGAFGKIVEFPGRGRRSCRRSRRSWAASISVTLRVRIATDAAGKPVLFKYGLFLQTALRVPRSSRCAIFVVIKGINRLKRPRRPPRRRRRPRVRSSSGYRGYPREG